MSLENRILGVLGLGHLGSTVARVVVAFGMSVIAWSQNLTATAYLVNTARGPIVDEPALVRALQARAIAGAGLDVFDQEPLPPDHPLTQLDDTVLMPHAGYVTETQYRVRYRDTVENVAADLGGAPLGVLNPGARA
jgi:phosphoglycerate dehydrogenase-like enzyme